MSEKKHEILVILNVAHYCGQRRVKRPKTIVRRHRRAIAEFRDEVGQLLCRSALPSSTVTFIGSNEALAMVTLECPKGVILPISRMKGVLAVSHECMDLAESAAPGA